MSHELSLQHLAQHDPVMAELIKRVELQSIKPSNNHFESLASSIISQQLSTKAARTIKQRFVSLFGKKFPTPQQVLERDDEELRRVGLSFSKILYIKNIAQAVEENVINFKKLSVMNDAEIIAELIKIKGVGIWTAEMFLIFSLGRDNIYSYGDLGLKNAVKKIYNLDHKLDSVEFTKLLESWAPYKSMASRILWKSLELKDEETSEYSVSSNQKKNKRPLKFQPLKL